MTGISSMPCNLAVSSTHVGNIYFPAFSILTQAMYDLLWPKKIRVEETVWAKFFQSHHTVWLAVLCSRDLAFLWSEILSPVMQNRPQQDQQPGIQSSSAWISQISADWQIHEHKCLWL